jgi:outer membrane protein OmpA-like peptidoglycan-associated protein
LEAKPEDPLKFILYFESDTTKLSPDSKQQLPEILSIITSRTTPDIGVIGHTDRTASDEYNHQLSMRRAITIRDTIVTGGIDPHVLEVHRAW